MKFLSVVLKIISVIVLIGVTIFCTAVCVEESAYMETAEYMLMGAIWLLGLTGALCFWGTGLALGQIPKLKAQIRQLEQRLYDTYSSMKQPAVQPIVPNFEDTITAPAPQPVDPAASEISAGKKPAKKLWLPISIAAVAVVIVAVVLILVLGGKDASAEPAPPPIEPPVAAQDIQVPAQVEATMEPAVSEEPDVAPAVDLDMGVTLTTDFVGLNIWDATVSEDGQYSVTTGNVTRTSGPQPVAGQQYLILTGTIVNTSTAPLPVYDFFIGNFNIDGYNFEVDTNDCSVLDGEGQFVSEIDPLMEYLVRIYVAIPDSLAASITSCEFTFGFYDGFDNQELSYNRSFAEDPISLCPYQYKLKVF